MVDPKGLPNMQRIRFRKICYLQFKGFKTLMNIKIYLNCVFYKSSKNVKNIKQHLVVVEVVDELQQKRSSYEVFQQFIDDVL